MKRERTLRRQLDSLDTLGEAVNAMKSLTAHHLRAARGGLTLARAYRDGIDRLIASAGLVQMPPRAGATALLLVAGDLGLCDGFNTRLVATALDERRRLDAARIYCVGRRPLRALRRASITPARTYATVTSAAGLTGLLLTLADDVLGDYLHGGFATLQVVSARFDGVGAFSPVSTQVLPVAPGVPDGRRAATPYVSLDRLTRVAIREYLYSTLYELLLDALAAEHGMRLVATQAAAEWLDGRIADVHRQLASVRRESSTQEVLEVAAGARQRRRAVAASVDGAATGR